MSTGPRRHPRRLWQQTAAQTGPPWPKYEPPKPQTDPSKSADSGGRPVEPNQGEPSQDELHRDELHRDSRQERAASQGFSFGQYQQQSSSERPPRVDEPSFYSALGGAPGQHSGDRCLDFCPICRFAEIVRATAPQEFQGQLALWQQEGLLALRSLLDHYLERVGQRANGSNTVEDIPID